MGSEANICQLDEGEYCVGAAEHFYIGDASDLQEEGEQDCVGTVMRFYEDRGYGFIAPDQGGRDVFVHRDGVEGDGGWLLSKGQRVSYREAKGLKGRKAVNVRVEVRGPERGRDGHDQPDGRDDPWASWKGSRCQPSQDSAAGW